jgi:hypothetical protein
MLLRKLLLMLTSSSAILLAACGAGTSEQAVEDTTALPPEVAAAHTEDAALGGHVDESTSADGDGHGLSSGPYANPMSICSELQEPMARTLGLPLTSVDAKPADVRNEIWGVTLDGCQLTAQSLGRDLAIGANHRDLPAFRLRRLLRNFGWRENTEYQMSEAGETTAGFERQNALCLVNVAFAPPAGVACPESDPVTCGRSPLDLEYRVALRCALP